MTIVIDIDDTLLLYPKNIDKNDIKNRIKNIKPNTKEIELLNRLKKTGYTIILHTARRWDLYDITIKQMKKYNIQFDQLVMGKPIGIYIDSDSEKSIANLLNDNSCKIDYNMV